MDNLGNTGERPRVDQRAGTPSPHRLHMGVATSDPQYLPVTEPARRAPRGAAPGTAPQGPAHPVSEQRAPLHYDRYLQTPKRGRAIFSSRQERARRRTRVLLALLVLAVIIVAFVWFVILR